MGEEHLGDGDAVGFEAALPCLHEERLADGGTGLFAGELGGFFLEAEAAHAEADGAGGHHDDFGAGEAEGGDLGGDGGDADGVQLADAGREHAGAELDDDALGGGSDGG